MQNTKEKGKVTEKNGFHIYGWMITDLDLHGDELIVYAVIYGVSQHENSYYYGSRKYLANWCGTTTRTITTVLERLENKGYIEAVERVAGETVKYIAYDNEQLGLSKNAKNISSENISPVENISGENISMGGENISMGGEKFSHKLEDNIEIKRENSNIILKNNMAEPLQENSSELNIQERPKRKVYLNDDFSSKAYSSDKEEKQKKKNLSLFDKCALAVDEYTTDEELRKALKNYLAVRLRIKGDKALKGINQWKASLNILSTLKSDKIKVVNKAAERNWASFFEVEDRYKDNTYTKPNRAIFGETEEMTNKRPNEVEGGGFSGLIF